MEKTKRRKKGKNGLIMAVVLVCCGGVGALLGVASAHLLLEGAGTTSFFSMAFVQLFLLFLTYYLQLIFHEGGHLIAGLLTGYRFSSFRIGSRMLLKTSAGWSLKRFSLAGTGGQCLLIPPEKRPDGTYPYKLYHLGGVLMNLLVSAVFLLLYLLCPAPHGVRLIFLYFVFSGAITFLTNGIPMRVGGIANDAYNVLHIGKDPAALEAMWIQLKVNEAQTEGIRLEDLPDEWFRGYENAAKNNEIISTISVFEENRAMDALDFRKAKECIEALKSENVSIIGLYKNLLLLDEVTIDLIENGPAADISPLDGKECRSFRKAMKRYPAMIRTEYAIRLLKEKDPAGAEKYQELFDKTAKTYPLQSDIDSEREIMARIDACAEKAAERKPE